MATTGLTLSREGAKDCMTEIPLTHEYPTSLGGLASWRETGFSPRRCAAA